jgi:phenylalanyl-tRNA synthetase alpha chain
MEEKVKSIQQELDAFLVKSKEDLENFRLKFISKKGMVSSLFDELKAARREKEVRQSTQRFEAIGRRQIQIVAGIPR